MGEGIGSDKGSAPQARLMAHGHQPAAAIRRCLAIGAQGVRLVIAVEGGNLGWVARWLLLPVPIFPRIQRRHV